MESKSTYRLVAKLIEKGMMRSEHGVYTLTDLALDLADAWAKADPGFDRNAFLHKSVGFIPRWE